MGKILDVTTEEQTKLWAEAHEGAVHSDGWKKRKKEA